MINDSTGATKKQGFLAALHYPNYRFLWVSTLGVTAAMSMEMVVIGWLVLELTNSPVLVGLAGACRFAGMGLGPFWGALADRFNRRHILVIERAANIVYALTFVALYYTSLLEIWHIFVLALLGGTFRAIDFTTRYALATDTVESHNLTSAISLLYVGMGITSVVGPLIGGYLFEPIGASGCFGIMAIAYLLSCLLLLPMRRTIAERRTHPESAWQSMISGLRYIMNDRLMSALIILAAIANLFAFPCMVGIMPVFARDVLHLGSDGLGWLAAAEGLGALVGALVASSLGGFKHKERLLVGSFFVWSSLLGIFAGLRLFYVGLALLFASGIARMISMAIIQVLLLTRASEEIRGRVSGIRMFTVVMLPIGNILSGGGATLWGAPTVMVLNALACILTTIFTAFWAPEMHRRQE